MQSLNQRIGSKIRNFGWRLFTSALPPWLELLEFFCIYAMLLISLILVGLFVFFFVNYLFFYIYRNFDWFAISVCYKLHQPCIGLVFISFYLFLYFDFNTRLIGIVFISFYLFLCFGFNSWLIHRYVRHLNISCLNKTFPIF